VEAIPAQMIKQTYLHEYSELMEKDNILFSCCCARVSYIWSTVCDCYTGNTYKCNLTCLENEIISDKYYYHTALEIYYNVTEAYPNSTIWLTGHSLGGALASLIGLTFGVPTVTFESPPERLASGRLHLPSPPGLKPEDMLIWHFGHTADPLYMGICTVYLPKGSF
jgi:lipase ATG15